MIQTHSVKIGNLQQSVDNLRKENNSNFQWLQNIKRGFPKANDEACLIKNIYGISKKIFLSDVVLEESVDNECYDHNGDKSAGACGTSSTMPKHEEANIRMLVTWPCQLQCSKRIQPIPCDDEVYGIFVDFCQW